MGMSMPPTTPGWAWGVGGWVWGVGAGGVSEPFFVERPNWDSGTVFGSLFATGFGASAIGSGMDSFFATGGTGGVTTVFSTTPDTPPPTPWNLMLSVETSCGAAACMAA